MEKNEIFKELNENLENLDDIENEISMIELAIYQKNIDNIKEKKINEIREFFKQQSKIYNQNIKKYKNKIDENVEEYEKQIERLISIYDNTYINIFKMMQSAINNQKITIANIVTLTQKLYKENLLEEEAKKIQNTIIANAQKKLNYSVIIDECKARIKWCIENVQIDINQIFKNSINQLQIYKDNIFVKIRKVIFNKMLGRSKYKKFLEGYQVEYMKDIESKNNLKILEIISILKGIIKQIEKTKDQISVQYEKVINS